MNYPFASFENINGKESFVICIKYITLKKNNIQCHYYVNFFGCSTMVSKETFEDIQGLMDHAMALATNKVDYYNFLDTKGWGLYKQGKCKEALKILEETWNSAPFPLYSIYSHLEEVKKAAGNNHVL